MSKKTMAHNISGIITSFAYKENLPNILLGDNFHLLPIQSNYGTTSTEKPITPYEELTPEIRELLKKLSFSL